MRPMREIASVRATARPLAVKVAPRIDNLNDNLIDNPSRWTEATLHRNPWGS
jgi:hypothetical protein